MRITDFIREAIIGKDATLSMFDIAGHIYKTRSPSKFTTCGYKPGYHYGS